MYYNYSPCPVKNDKYAVLQSALHLEANYSLHFLPLGCHLTAPKKKMQVNTNASAWYSAVRIHLLCPCAPHFGPSALGQNYVLLGSIFSMNLEGCVRLGQIGQNWTQPVIFA